MKYFHGYPWFYKDKFKNIQTDKNLNTFPFAISKDLRCNLIRNDILNEITIKEYIDFRYRETLKNITYLENEDKEYRNMQYITIKWFMSTLVERTEKIATAVDLDVRMPFSDYRIFEYVYNLNKELKFNNLDKPTEKYLLKKAFENELPEDIIKRKKSPFPKTYNLEYLNLVKEELTKIINNKNNRIQEFINIEYLKNIIDTNGENLTENFFGQLMTYPQLLAYIIQIEYWLNIYNIEVKI
ncbi:MAG: asparagine synthase-related protein [Clostridia bacterium]